MQDNRIPPQTRPMTEAEMLRRRKLRRAAIKRKAEKDALSYRLRPCGGAAHSGHRAAVPGLRPHRGKPP